jgi:hypothetical protein
MLERANAGLAEPFRGIAGGGEILPGLFALEKNGVSLAPVVEAARSLLATLTAEQRQAACFAIGDDKGRFTYPEPGWPPQRFKGERVVTASHDNVGRARIRSLALDRLPSAKASVAATAGNTLSAYRGRLRSPA